jgi:carbonic anhydrase
MPRSDDTQEMVSESREGDALLPTFGRRAILRGAVTVLPAAAGLTLGVGCGGSSDAQEFTQPQDRDEALQALKDGNRRFYEQKPRVLSTKEIERIWTKTEYDQAPFASVLGCADSRLAPELIFDQFIGDVFVVREAGNIAHSPTNLGSLEYAQAVLRSKLILVLGHTDCGAVSAAFGGGTYEGHIQAIVDAIRPGIAGATTLDEAITDNVFAVIDEILANSPLLKDAEEEGEIYIVGGLYSVATGKVQFL